MKKIIVANWKMNPSSVEDALSLITKTKNISSNHKDLEVVVCPPFPFLYIYKKLKIKNINLGSQNIFYESEGSYTGQVSHKMLSSLGVKYVIVGHSESRIEGDTNDIVNRKLLGAINAKIIPILCIGEKSRDDHKEYLDFIKDQIHECLAGIPKNKIKNIIIAYEPIWAVGKNAKREATKDEFIETRILIKRILSDMYGFKIASSVRVLYGGSVSGENSLSFIKEGEADGLLVGRNSLSPNKFEEILSSLSKNKK
jgi:triosephosphate isomerase